MWERCAPRLRRAIGRALSIAGRRGEAEASSRDLLAAIVADRQSGGAIVLGRCGVDSKKLQPLEECEASERGRAEKVSPDFLAVLEAAGELAARWGHGHVGTEHAVAAMARAPGAAGKLLGELGLKAAAAEAAAIDWVKLGMPRRQGVEGGVKKSEKGAKGIVGKAMRAVGMGVDVYFRKSLGHPGYVSNPYPLYRWLRRREPVRRDPIAPVWVLTRYEDVAMMLRDPRLKKDPFASERLPAEAARQLGVMADRVEVSQVSMLFLDPPLHTRVRGVFAKWFTPATLSALRPRIELICRRRLERLEGRKQIDLIADLAYSLPVMVIAEILGFDGADYVKFKEWSDAMAASLALRASDETYAAAAAAREQMREYFDRVVPRLKQSPNDSLLSRLLENEGTDQGLTRDEIFTNCVLLLAAGHETTTNLIGNGVLALMRQRQAWKKLVADPSLIDSAVEEMLRFDSPVQWTSRMSAEQITIAGVTIPEGEIVLGCVGAANRDPQKFADPDRFDPQRKGAKHLSFGVGAHYCLGAALAPMEASIALRQLVERYPRMRLASKRLRWMKGLTFRGVTSLPLRVD